MFLGLMAYFTYFEVVKSEDFINSPYNKRTESFAKTIVRGEIRSEDGKVLAQNSVNSDGTEVRNYPYGNMFAHVVGYNSNGKAGIESIANFYLLRSHTFVLNQVVNELKGVKNPGDHVISTLDYDLQAAAYQALGSYDGAVVVLEPSTGKIRAMVSKPDFDPNTVAAQWDSIVSSESSVLVNRATQGQYPPGSTFKIVTSLEYLKENGFDRSMDYTCNGSLTVGDSTINCYGGTAHGGEDLSLAFAKSCNCYFSQIGLGLDLDSYHSMAEKLLFNQKLPIPLPYKSSSFTLKKGASTAEIMQTSIGQGETLVSPMHMAMIVSAIANDGVLMKPYLIDHTESEEGTMVRSYESEKYASLMKKEEAEKIKELMQGVVDQGTASALSGQQYRAYGKTGSAEFGEVKGQSHAWFVGFAAKDEQSQPDLAVAVLVEGAGGGSTYAVPIAKQVFETYYASGSNG